MYRAFLKQANLMPTENRAQFVRLKARRDFKAAKQLTAPEQVQFHVALAETQLENGM
jgi:hypothetical protein